MTSPRPLHATGRFDRRLVAAAVCALACARSAAAQACERTESRTSLAAFAGERINRLDVTTDDPLSSGIGAKLGWLHVRTRGAAVRQRLLIAAGDVLDTARVAESLRRLRRLRFLNDASIVAERCAGVDGVALTIVTHDAWSIAPEARLATTTAGAMEQEQMPHSSIPNGMLSLEERNFLGSGREVRVALESRGGLLGGSASVNDPFLFGRPLVGRFRVARLPNEHALQASIRTDERLDATPWRSFFSVGRLDRWPLRAAALGRIERTAAQALVGHRLTADDAPSALYVSGGAEYASAGLRRFAEVKTPGPADVDRAFVGANVALDRVTQRYRPALWLLPRDGVYDVPQGFESSVMLGFGHERVLGAPAAHLDAWVGRIWQPTSGSLLSTDVWTSGYLVRRGTTASTLRLATTGIARAAGGTWTIRVAGERLVAPDPDVRVLLGLDPTSRMIETGARLAGTAVAASLERAVRVNLPVGHSSVDLAAFGAGSLRRATCGIAPSDVGAAAVGLGLRAVPNAAGRNALRVDYLIPVAGSLGVRRRPFATLTFAPGFGADRVRDGMRSR